MVPGDQAGPLPAAPLFVRLVWLEPSALFDPEIEWHTRADLPDSGVHRGHEGAAALVQEWVGSFEDLHFDIEDVIDRGDCVVISMVLRGRIRGSDEEVSMPETHVHKMRDGMTVELRECPNARTGP